MSEPQPVILFFYNSGGRKLIITPNHRQNYPSLSYKSGGQKLIVNPRPSRETDAPDPFVGTSRETQIHDRTHQIDFLEDGLRRPGRLSLPPTPLPVSSHSSSLSLCLGLRKPVLLSRIRDYAESNQLLLQVIVFRSL